MKCPKCGVENAQGSKFCSRCGTVLGNTSPQGKSGRVRCPKCGTKNDPMEGYCYRCGTIFAEYHAGQNNAAPSTGGNVQRGMAGTGYPHQGANMAGNYPPGGMVQPGNYPQGMQPGGGTPQGYYPQGEPNKPSGGKGFGIASMVLGIVALSLSCCFYYVSIPCAVIGVVLGVIGLKRAGRGMAIAGLVCSVVSLIPAIFVLATGAALFEAMGASL